MLPNTLRLGRPAVADAALAGPQEERKGGTSFTALLTVCLLLFIVVVPRLKRANANWLVDLKDEKENAKVAKVAHPVALNMRGRADPKHEPALLYLTGKFGHDNCFQAAVTVQQKAIEKSGVFSSVFAHYKFPQFIVEDDRFVRHTQFLRNKKDISHRGGGFWFWKAALAANALASKAQDGDLLVFSDVDRIDFVDTISVVADAMTERSLDFAVTRRNRKGMIENRWTKRDIFDEFKVNPHSEAGDGRQYLANLWVARNTPSTRRFFDAWLRCVANWHLVSDEPSKAPNVKDFRENRHDQSLLSMIIKSAGVVREAVRLDKRTEPQANLWEFFNFDKADLAVCL
jgi:hypothetical protein